MTDTRSVNIEVYCDNSGPYGVLTEHRPDLPERFNERLQEWVRENFRDLIDGDEIFYAGGMEYEPDGEIVGFTNKICER